MKLYVKGCICHFVKWQMHPFISKGTDCWESVFILDQHHRRYAKLNTTLGHFSVSVEHFTNPLFCDDNANKK